MERKINYLSVCYILALILMFISGFFGGFWSEVVYYLVFLLPTVLGLLLDKQRPFGDAELFAIKTKDIRVLFPLILPTIFIVMLTSFITSIIIFTLTGAENSVDVGDSLIPALISHALVPALFEEILFRYLPMKLLAGESKRVTVLASAIFFALAHHNLFSIPYAFLAGIIFMAIDVSTNSIIPSILIHFINNAISVGMLVYEDNAAFTPTLFTILAVLLVISIAYILKRKEAYIDEIKRIFKKDRSVVYTLPFKIFIVISLFVAVITLS